MSLKFGLYLVEQGIITCDQFCGLVKIQQESKSSIGTIAIQKNIMTIRQVANVLEELEGNKSQDFIEVAQEMGLIDHAASIRLQQLDQLSRPKLRQIMVDVGLMNQRQVGMLFEHHGRVQKRLNKKTQIEKSPAGKAPVAPRQPKFQQRPVKVTEHYTSNF